MKRNELKQIIKECIIELFVDGASSSPSLVESLDRKKVMSKPIVATSVSAKKPQQLADVMQRQVGHQTIGERKKQINKRHSPLDERVTPFSQRMSQQRGSVNIFDDIASDTLNTTLLEQSEVDHENAHGLTMSDISVYEEEIAVPDGADRADFLAARLDPSSMHLDNKWEKLAFQTR